MSPIFNKCFCFSSSSRQLLSPRWSSFKLFNEKDLDVRVCQKNVQSNFQDASQLDFVKTLKSKSMDLGSEYNLQESLSK